MDELLKRQAELIDERKRARQTVANSPSSTSLAGDGDSDSDNHTEEERDDGSTEFGEF